MCWQKLEKEDSTPKRAALRHAAIYQFKIAVPLNGILRFCPNQGINGGKKIEADFDINQKLKDWLAGEYNQRTIDIKGIDLKKKKPTKGSVFK